MTTNPNQPKAAPTHEEMLAIYADRAVSSSCVACHNSHPHSSKTDFSMHDVMGGLVIEIPLER